jgi:hypothetical protein
MNRGNSGRRDRPRADIVPHLAYGAVAVALDRLDLIEATSADGAATRSPCVDSCPDGVPTAKQGRSR